MVQHASLHCDTVSATQIATSPLPRFPSTALQLSGTVFFPGIEEEKERKVSRHTGRDGFLLGYTGEKVSFFKQMSQSCMFLSTALVSEKKYVRQLLVHLLHRSQN